LFDKPLAAKIAHRFAKCEQAVVDTDNCDTVSVDLTEHFDAIKMQLETLTQQLKIEPGSRTEDALFETTAPTKIALYYFNQSEDQKLAPEQQVNVNSILPVYRIFPASKNVLVDVINELLKGNLTAIEKQQGFVTEFPQSWFKLIWSELIPDGTLILSFTEVPGFTSGWSARMLILSSVIEKTMLQFPGVKKVVFSPEEIFQP